MTNATFDLDFTELAKSAAVHRGFPFQSLIGEMLQGLGYRTERGGTGSDGGRDLFFYPTYNPLCLDNIEYQHKWLVSCKDNSEGGSSVSRGDFNTLYSDAKSASCDGVLVATTTQSTDNFVRHAEGWARHETAPLKSVIWDAHKINSILHENEKKFRLMLIRYFPDSYGAKELLSDKVLMVALDLVKKLPDEKERVNYAIQINQNLEDPASALRLVKTLTESVPDFKYLKPLLLQWKDNDNRDFQTSFEIVMGDFTDNQEFKEIDGLLAKELGRTYSHVNDSELTYLNVYNFSMDSDGDELTIMTDFEFEANVRSFKNHKACSGSGQYWFGLGPNGKECFTFSASSEDAEKMDDQEWNE